MKGDRGWSVPTTERKEIRNGTGTQEPLSQRKDRGSQNDVLRHPTTRRTLSVPSCQDGPFRTRRPFWTGVHKQRYIRFVSVEKITRTEGGARGSVSVGVGEGVLPKVDVYRRYLSPYKLFCVRRRGRRQGSLPLVSGWGGWRRKSTKWEDVVGGGLKYQKSSNFWRELYVFWFKEKTPGHLCIRLKKDQGAEWGKSPFGSMKHSSLVKERPRGRFTPLKLTSWGGLKTLSQVRVVGYERRKGRDPNRMETFRKSLKIPYRYSYPDHFSSTPDHLQSSTNVPTLLSDK